MDWATTCLRYGKTRLKVTSVTSFAGIEDKPEERESIEQPNSEQNEVAQRRGRHRPHRVSSPHGHRSTVPALTDEAPGVADADCQGRIRLSDRLRSRRESIGQRDPKFPPTSSRFLDLQLDALKGRADDGRAPVSLDVSLDGENHFIALESVRAFAKADLGSNVVCCLLLGSEKSCQFAFGGGKNKTKAVSPGLIILFEREFVSIYATVSGLACRIKLAPKPNGPSSPRKENGCNAAWSRVLWHKLGKAYDELGGGRRNEGGQDRQDRFACFSHRGRSCVTGADLGPKPLRKGKRQRPSQVSKDQEPKSDPKSLLAKSVKLNPGLGLEFG